MSGRMVPFDASRGEHVWKASKETCRKGEQVAGMLVLQKEKHRPFGVAMAPVRGLCRCVST